MQNSFGEQIRVITLDLLLELYFPALQKIDLIKIDTEEFRSPFNRLNIVSGLGALWPVQVGSAGERVSSRG